MYTDKDRSHFLREQLKNYNTRKYRVEVEMEMLRTCTKDIPGYMSQSALEEKEEAVAKQMLEVDIAISVCEARLAQFK
jgi:hypothetical protein